MEYCMPCQVKKVTFNVIQISGCMLSWRWYENSRGGGLCVAGGHVWQGVCMAEGMCGGGHAWQGRACMGGMHAMYTPPPRQNSWHTLVKTLPNIRVKMSKQSIIELFSPCKSWPNSECPLSTRPIIQRIVQTIVHTPVNRKCEWTLTPINLLWKF